MAYTYTVLEALCDAKALLGELYEEGIKTSTFGPQALLAALVSEVDIKGPGDLLAECSDVFGPGKFSCNSGPERLVARLLWSAACDGCSNEDAGDVNGPAGVYVSLFEEGKTVLAIQEDSHGFVLLLVGEDARNALAYAQNCDEDEEENATW